MNRMTRIGAPSESGIVLGLGWFVVLVLAIGIPVLTLTHAGRR